MFNEVLIDNSRWVQRRKKYVLCRYVTRTLLLFGSYVIWISYFSYVIWILKEPTFFLMLTFILLATSQLLFFWNLWVLKPTFQVFFWLLDFVGSTNFFGFCGFTFVKPASMLFGS